VVVLVIDGNENPLMTSSVDVGPHSIDLLHMGVPGAIAAWAVEGPQGWVLIESGPSCTGETLDQGLRDLGVEPEQLAALLLTHIHLDHGGGAWRFSKRGVPVYVHAAGAKHLIDPSRLERSSRQIFGDRYELLWGSMHPCDASLVHAVTDGGVIKAGGLEFEVVETLGHANHHHAWYLRTGSEAAGGLFSGDAAAMRVPGTDWLTLPMPPPEFDLDVWMKSIDRIESGPWRRLHLTHGGTVEDIPSHCEQLRASMRSQVAWVSESSGEDREDRYRAMLWEQASTFDVPRELFDAHITPGLLGMNLTGIDRWASKQGE
jgi:glyoxylase-like metal-dependent hydrolase (beta-lactamase superfamily II)